MSDLSNTFRSLHEHSIWQVLASYLFVSWLVLQVTETVSSLVGLPLWMGRAVLITLLAGLPVLLATALIKLIPGAGNIASWPARILTWRNAVFGGLAAFLLLALGTVGYLAMRTAGVGPVGTLFATGTLDEADPVLLAEFKNSTDDPGLSALVTEILRIDLQRSMAITLVEPEAVAAGLERMGLEPAAELPEERARELAQREGLKAIVTGSIAGAGANLVISARVVAADDGRDLVAIRETARDEGDLIDAVDRLSGRLRERVGESLKDIQGGEPLEDVTTSSIEALRLYTQGGRAWDQGDTERALALMEEAVRIDTTFASAYRGIAVILGNRFEQASRSRDAATKAYRFADRLPVTERYMSIAYYHLQVDGDLQEAINAYRTLLEIDPTNKSALNNLGVVYSTQHDFERADGVALQVVELEPDAQAYGNLVTGALQLNQADSARARLERFRQVHPGHPTLRSLEAQVAAADWDWDRAVAAWDTVLAENPGNLFWTQVVYGTKGETAYMRGRVAEAETMFAAAERAALERGVPLEALRQGLALAVADRLLRDDPQAAARRYADVTARFPLDQVSLLDRPSFDLVHYHVRMGELEIARAYVEEMEAAEAFSIVPALKIQHRFSAGLLALGEGRWEEAIETFSQATEGTQCAVCAESWLGEAYDRMSMPDSAIVFYTAFVEHLNRFSSLDMVEVPRVLLRLAELHQERGDVDLAVVYYARFVDLWAEADPELQGTVRAVQQRIEQLAETAAGLI